MSKMYGLVKTIIGAIRSIFTRSTAASLARLAVVWSAVWLTEPFSLRVTTNKVIAMKVMMARRMRVITNATPCWEWRRAREEDPRSNIQAPEKIQAPTLKHSSRDPFWSLLLRASLELGSWSLMLIRVFIDKPRNRPSEWGCAGGRCGPGRHG